MTGSAVNTPRYGTAVVIGGSIAGSAAAVALTEHFERTVVLDRDVLPASPSSRKGAPHSYHFHALLVGGKEAFEDLLPGLTDEAVALGVPLVDIAADTRIGQKVGWFPRFEHGKKLLMPTRRFLEWLIRRRVSTLPGVEYMAQTRVTGLLAENGRVTGVRIVNEPGGAEQTISADFVVDASGRSSQAPEWLQAIGFPAPEETVVNARWGYSTVYFRPPVGREPSFATLYLSPTVSGSGLSATRGGAAWAQEDGTWVLTAQGCAGDYPPGDFDGMREYLLSVGDPVLTELVSHVEPIAPVESWRNTSNRLRDFAGLSARPERFVAIGDSVAAYNPIYGQGMSVAAFSALELRAALAEFVREHTDRNLDGFAERYQTRVSGIIDGAWQFSTGSDFNIPGVELDGAPVPASAKPQASEYGDRVLALAVEDPEIAAKFLETIHFLRTPEWMADEALQQRVMKDWDRLGKFVRS
ncbi:FAD-dependent oxidoreductase [Nocardia neocaledoniensis]|uniref:FAD-dependent oxidoreductase n=1 Tax=Nocardia neocaledoniensis TaxID=236511 RepID=UPI002454F28D|nr:FAD-dependent monooxygenase [Nocardia neocaledoniensis]